MESIKLPARTKLKTCHTVSEWQSWTTKEDMKAISTFKLCSFGMCKPRFLTKTIIHSRKKQSICRLIQQVTQLIHWRKKTTLKQELFASVNYTMPRLSNQNVMETTCDIKKWWCTNTWGRGSKGTPQTIRNHLQAAGRVQL